MPPFHEQGRAVDPLGFAARTSQRRQAVAAARRLSGTIGICRF
ncbi:MAG: hypothetical protein ACT6RN_02715 [Agrobacterium sp.]